MMSIHWHFPFHRQKKPVWYRVRLIAAAVGVILMWYGVWELLYTIPIIGQPLIALILGLAILIASGLFYDRIS